MRIDSALTTLMTTAKRKPAQPLYEMVYDAIKERISDGVLRPGDPVSEINLAEALSVSRTPVRDAIRRLITENLLVAPANGPIQVYAPRAADIAEIYAARAAMESLAARMAAMTADPVFIQQLRDICDNCLELQQRSNLSGPMLSRDLVKEAARFNGMFHQAILDKAGNARLNQLIANLRPVIARYRHISLAHTEHLTESWNEHRRIIDYFVDCSPETVEQLVRNHILKAGGRIVSAMMHLEGDDTPPTPSMILVLSESGLLVPAS